MIKSFQTENEVGIPSEKDLELIGKYSLRPLKKEEVFIFSVILCDNEIDRDFERFSEQSLKSLEGLFVGKTGILNHSMKSDDQNARTYKTALLRDSVKKTTDGRDYVCLKAWCYTVRSDKNSSLISDIESGIKKEVSVSCNSGEKVCSICGKDRCSHIPGARYGERLCFKTIENVTDAYEWSFVAVPAQRNAGVTKSAGISKKEKNMENILKSIKTEKTLTLNEKELCKLSDYIESLEKKSGDGEKYRLALKNDAKKSFAVLVPALDGECVEEIAKSLSSDKLESLCDALHKQTAKIVPSASQLFSEKNEIESNTNGQFKF